REIIETSRERPNVIKHARSKQDASARHQTVAWLHREDATERAGPNDRAVRLRSDGERDHPGADRCGRARGGTAGRPPQIMRIARWTRMKIGKFGGDGLTDDHGAGRT